MKLLTTLALLSTAILANAATIPAQLASSLESRKSCNTPGSGKNYCGGGRECGDGPGIYTCSVTGQIVAIACCGPNGCQYINDQPFCV